MTTLSTLSARRFSVVVGLIVLLTLPSRSEDKHLTTNIPKLEVQQVSFGGTGNTRIVNITDKYVTSSGGSNYASPEWDSTASPAATNPCSYVVSSSPTLTVAFKVTPAAKMSVKIKAVATQVTPSVTLNYGPSDLTLDGTGTATLSSFTTTDKLSDKIDSGNITISFKVSYDGGANYTDISTTTTDQILTTLTAPTGFVSYIRLNYWCIEATGKNSANDVADTIGPDAVSGKRFGYDGSIYGKNGQHVDNAWAAMDGTRCDCITLSTLMMESMNLVGAPGAQTRFVWPKHANWTNLWDTTGTHQETLVTASPPRNTLLGFDSGGWNNYEGCCFFNNKWWMGGSGISEATALDVLQHWTLPNNVDDGPSTPNNPATNKQCYQDAQSVHVPYPPGAP
jgi:hypothetical protein